jgi:diamine N-acetyltransferase
MITLPTAPGGGPAASLATMTVEDANALAPVFAVMDPWQRYGDTAERLTSYFSEADANAPRFVIACNNERAGVIVIHWHWLGGPYVQFLGMVPDYQKAGLGGRVLQWFETEARTRAARNIWIAASDFNAPALAFYMGFGFERVAVLDDLLRDGIAEILLRKRL